MSLISGVFILNLVFRDKDLRDQVVGDLRAVLPELYSIGIEGEINEIVIALPQLRHKTATEDISWHAKNFLSKLSYEVTKAR